MVNIPYNKIELLTELIGIEKKISVRKLNKTIKEIQSEMEEKIPTNQAGVNMLIAKENGISVEALINSPNLKLLQSQYQDKIYTSIKAMLEEKLQITSKEAWALLAAALGLLD